MAAMCLRKEQTHDSGERNGTSTVKNLRVLLVLRNERALHPKAQLSWHRRTPLNFRLSSVVFVPSPFFIAVLSDSSMPDTSTCKLLSALVFPKAEKIGDQIASLSMGPVRLIKESSCNVEFDERAVARTL